MTSPPATILTARARLLLLVIDPDTMGSRSLQRQLTARQVDVLVTDDPADGLLQAGTLLPDVVLTAAEVPPMRGCEIARALYGRTGIPAIVGVAPGDTDEASEALAAGAIASVVRPYRLEQILPVLSSLPRNASAPEPVRVGRLVLDPAAHEVHIGDRRVDLPQREFDLLHLLMAHAGQVVSRRQIYRLLWNADDAGSNTLAVHIKRLRARLGHGRGDPSITSVRGLGYRLDRRRDDNG
jgi:DNA-binding response OmpR family regulator